MTKAQINDMVWKIAREYAEKGPGWSQEGVVLRELHDRIGGNRDPMFAQQVLDAWHDLFAEKKLGWGYNWDNPNSPFFHIRQPVEAVHCGYG